MSLRELIEDLTAHPEKYIASKSPMDLGAFFQGMYAANRGVSPVTAELVRSVEGPDAMNAWSRAYLKYDHEADGFAALVSAVKEALTTVGPMPSQVAVGAEKGFAEPVVEAVEQGRPAMVLGECTVPWLFHYAAGFVAAQAIDDPAGAREMRTRLGRFDAWLEEQYPPPKAPWGRLIRIYHGVGLEGVKAFARLWQEFLSENPEKSNNDT